MERSDAALDCVYKQHDSTLLSWFLQMIGVVVSVLYEEPGVDGLVCFLEYVNSYSWQGASN